MHSNLDKYKSKSPQVTKHSLRHGFLSFLGELMKCHHIPFKEVETEAQRNEVAA